MSERSSVIIKLMEEIRVMEDTILYFQKRVLQKRIAIAELMNGVEQEIEEAEPEKPPRPRHGSVNWEAFLHERNGNTFNRNDLIAFGKSCKPGASELDVKRCVAVTLSKWLGIGRVHKTEDNQYVKKKPIQ